MRKKMFPVYNRVSRPSCYTDKHTQTSHLSNRDHQSRFCTIQLRWSSTSNHRPGTQSIATPCVASTLARVAIFFAGAWEDVLGAGRGGKAAGGAALPQPAQEEWTAGGRRCGGGHEEGRGLGRILEKLDDAGWAQTVENAARTFGRRVQKSPKKSRRSRPSGPKEERSTTNQLPKATRSAISRGI